MEMSFMVTIQVIRFKVHGWENLEWHRFHSELPCETAWCIERTGWTPHSSRNRTSFAGV